MAPQQCSEDGCPLRAEWVLVPARMVKPTHPADYRRPVCGSHAAGAVIGDHSLVLFPLAAA